MDEMATEMGRQAMQQRTCDSAQLNSIEREALTELGRRLREKFSFVEQLVLFGSVARGTATEESDIDLLIFTSHQLDNWIRREISDVNLEYETNICTIVLDWQSWVTNFPSILGIKQEIQRDGIIV